MFTCNNLPYDANDLIANKQHLPLRSIDLNIMCSVLDNLTDVISELFDDCEYGVTLSKHIIAHILQNISDNYKSNKYTIYGVCEDKNTLLRIITDKPKTVERIISSYINRNIFQYGAFLDMWEEILEIDISVYAERSGNEKLAYVSKQTGGVISDTSGNDYYDDEEIPIINDELTTDNDNTYNPDVTTSVDRAVEISFEMNRNKVIDEKYGFNHEHTIALNDKAEIKLTSDNSECLICYENGDYVCHECGALLCCDCIDKLRHSTAICPQCQKNLAQIDHIVNRPYYAYY